jgi:hypothetical protein
VKFFENMVPREASEKKAMGFSREESEKLSKSMPQDSKAIESVTRVQKDFRSQCTTSHCS